MKGKDVITKRFAAEYNELDSVAEFLEEKAAEGWELTSKTGGMYGFRKCEPKKVKISVELVVADENDSERTRFIEYCEASGWKHIFSDGKIQIFETADLDAEPIHTDPEVKLALVHKKCKGTNIILPIATILFTVLFMKNIMFPVDASTLFSWNAILPYFGFPIFCVLMAAFLMDYCLWYKRAKSCVAKGEHPVYKRSTFGKISNKILFVYIFGGMWGSIILDALYSADMKWLAVCSCGFAIVILFLFLFPRYSAKHTQDRKGNLGSYIAWGAVITLVLTVGMFAIDDEPEEPLDEELPLTLADLGIEKPDESGYYKSKEGSIIAKSFYGSESIQNDEWDGLHYLIYTTKYDWAYDMILEDCFSSYVKDYQEVDESAFAANKVYYSEDEKQWLLLYDDRIIEFGTSEDLTDAQLKIVAEKLNNEL